MDIGAKVSYVTKTAAKEIKVGDELVDGGKVTGVRTGGAWVTFTTEGGAIVKATRKEKLAVRVYGTLTEIHDDYLVVLVATYANGGFKINAVVDPGKVEAA
jgi:hypothetical protein